MKKGKFKRIQKDLNLTNRGMADLLGVQVSTVEKWRSGANRVTLQTEKHLKLCVAQIRQQNLDRFKEYRSVDDFERMLNEV